MAFVPVADIPNLGNVSSGTPLAPTGQQAPNLAGVGKALISPDLQQGAFDGSAQGTQNLGNAVSNVGGSVANAGGKLQAIQQDIKARKDAYQDEVSLSTYNMRRAKRFAEYQATLPGKSEADYVPGWEEFSKKTRDEDIEGLTFTERGAQALAINDIKFNGESVVGLTKAANQSAFTRGNDAILTDALRLDEEGRDEEAAAKIGRLVDLGAMSQEQAFKWQEQRKEVKRQNTLTSYMTGNPKAFYEDMQKEAKGEETDLSSFFTGPDRDIQIARQESLSRQYLQGKQSEQFQAGIEGIQNGTITNEAQLTTLDEEGGMIIDDSHRATWKKALANSVGVLDLKTYNTLTSEVMQYDPKSDKDGTIREDLKRRIGGELPTKESQALYGRLDGLVRSGKSNDAESEGARIIGNMYDDGLFGTFLTGVKAKELKGKDAEKNRQAMQTADIQRSRLSDAMTGWLTENPNATREQAAQFIYEQTKPMLQTKPNGWFNWNDPSNVFVVPKAVGSGVNWLFNGDKPPAPKAQEIQQFLDKQPKGSDMSNPKTTRYSLGAKVGGPDELEDKWTNRGYSSTGQNLTPGVVAVNDSKFPLGTIFKDEKGNAYIAADRHGNKDAAVVDIYEPPSAYGKSKTQPKLEVVGKVSRKQIPGTVEGVRKLLSQYGTVPPGESAVDWIKGRA